MTAAQIRDAARAFGAAAINDHVGELAEIELQEAAEAWVAGFIAGLGALGLEGFDQFGETGHRVIERLLAEANEAAKTVGEP
jgi:hypothetical protein